MAQVTGLHFPRERWGELRRGIISAAADFGYQGKVDEFARWLSAAPRLTLRQQQSLSSHLTVGETYFFRDRPYFDLLAQQILPEIIRKRQGRDRRLRLWSAACCTGEEVYSIGIVLQQVVPDLEQWDVTLLGSDINPQFLSRAEKGVFGKWSFRNVAAGIRERYFDAMEGGQVAIRPEIKRLVRFVPLNLAAETFPPELAEMDVIFCRNVLMYFAPSKAARVIHNFHRIHSEGGWLIVGPSELLHVSSSPYRTISSGSTVVYRKLEAAPAPPQSSWQSPDVVPEPAIPDLVAAAPANERPPEHEPVDLRQNSPSTADVEPPGVRARQLANEGKLAEALACCNRWVELEKLNPAAQYLRAVILQELGASEEAAQALRSTLYIDPDFVLAHFTLGNMARDRGRLDIARRHYSNVGQLLRGIDPSTILLEPEGITAGELIRMIPSSMAQGTS